MRHRAVVLPWAVIAGCAGPQAGPAQRLGASPRHQEWAEVKSGGRTVRCFIAWPEADRPAAAVIVIHENRGLSDWVRSVVDRLAGEGYLAVAPDLLSGAGPDGTGTSGFPDSDAAREAIYRLGPDQVTADLAAVIRYVRALPGSSGTLAVAGFCWGGSQTFRFATNGKELSATFVFYGKAPEDPDALGRIECPVYGFYGGNDARVNASLPATEKSMKQAAKTFEAVIYEGAAHAFMRRGEQPDADPANRQAATEAWERWLRLLGGL